MALKLIKPNSMRDNDPTLTLTIRSRYMSALSGRFRKISAEARKQIVNNNFFDAQKITNNIAINAYSYPLSPERIEGFMDFINRQIQNGIFESVLIYGSGSFSQSMWFNMYILSAYKAGLNRSNSDLTRMGYGDLIVDPETAIVGLLNAPVHINALKNIYIRQFEALKGITSEMASQIAIVLTNGISEGRGPMELARTIANRIDKIGITRAKRLARTEVIRSHNLASLQNYEQLNSLLTDKLQVQWWTALDERVRARHRRWHGEVMSIEEAKTRIGEPNCRCAVLPFNKKINETEDLDIPYDGWREAAA